MSLGTNLGLNQAGHSLSSLIGVHDDGLKCPAAQHASKFILQDQACLRNGPQENLDICEYADGQLHCYLTRKIPLSGREGLSSGIAVYMTDIKSELINTLLKLTNPRATESRLDSIQGSYHVGVLSDGIAITPRQHEVLFLILRGKTCREIANMLYVNVRTIETHVIHLKNLFGCTSKSALISEAIDRGYLYALPTNLFRQRY